MDLKTQGLSNTNPLKNSWVEEIFKRFHGRFGNRFLSNYAIGHLDSNGQDRGVENAKESWGMALAGYTPEEIKKGIEHTYAFMPDCDAFKLICRPSVDYEMAHVEAVEQMRLRDKRQDSWSSAAVYWAAAALGNDLSNYPYVSIKARWKTALDKARIKVDQGELSSVVPEKKVELPAPGKVTISKEIAAKRFAEVHDILSRKVSGNRDAA